MKTVFKPYDQSAVHHFVREGYVIYRGAHDMNLIDRCKKFFMDEYASRLRAAPIGKTDVNGWAVFIINEFQRTELYDELVNNQRVIGIMQRYLGPDVCLLGFDALWLNVPKDTDPVLLKGVHNDHWTGTSVNTIFGKVFFTDVDKYNSVSMCPGSHLQGALPVRNRQLDTDAKFKSVNLSNIRAGDLLIWHALLLHSTTGHSDKHIRISLTSRYSSTETPFSSQERALGYRTLSVGPLNCILRLIGNDALTPLRTYGGHVGIDRRMEKLYPHVEYRRHK